MNFENDHPCGAEAFAAAHRQEPVVVEEPASPEVETEVRGFVEDRKPRARSKGGINGFFERGNRLQSGFTSGDVLGFMDSDDGGSHPFDY